MGLLDNLKAFVHSITTEDHYASYDSPYRNDDNEPIGTSSQRTSTNDSVLPLNNDLNNSQYSLDNPAGAAGFYRPGMKSSQQDLPLQNFSANGQPPLPSIDSLWDRIEFWIEQEYPELEDNLNDGVTTADLNEFMQDLQIGRNLPDDFRQFYKRHDGQLRGGKPTGLIMGLVLLDLEAIVEEKILWTKVAERLEGQFYMAQHKQRQENIMKEGSSNNGNNKVGPINNSFVANQRSIPPNSIQPYYYHKGWVILLKDNIGNQVAMDLLPGPAGQVGQIILFGRDFDTKLVIASSLQEFLFVFVTDLEQGNFQIDSSEYQEQLGFLSNDRNGDFMVGDEDEDQGELSFWDKDGQEFGKNVIRGRLSYIEVLKRRALKKYGLSETFETSFVPQRIPKKQSQKQPGSGSTTPVINQSRNTSSSNLKKTATNGSATATTAATNTTTTAASGAAGATKNKPPIPSPLANADTASSSFSIPKETLLNKNNAEKDEDKPELSSEKATVDSKDPIETAKVSMDSDEKTEVVKVDDKEPEEVKVNNAKADESEKSVEPEVVPSAESSEESKKVESEETTEKSEVEANDESKKDTKENSNDETKEVTDGLKEVEL
ncbi:Killer toxin resistant protein, putative [Candida dubliniensis CD36]|uniref:Cell wall assembly regulator, putative n=1 Tax=Candida dubliniensis (strain CD36 / ATCC MYA-646 / CBS 7987 / NCPF 3949 / NRRL Y-17841) TaxID=573826 RepID=B9W8H0_CANDC|nr:Killer toxin resistant protein, putative [Candida dubliniensis CD36]CAX45040.1 Killer toxin resistant protein, putative [Candida dubliniensis CD36]